MDYYNQSLTKIEKVLGRGVTTDRQLDHIGKNLFGDKFKGVFMQDTLPKHFNGYAIVNVDLSNQRGSHWCGVSRSGRHCLVYDSFGRPSYRLLPMLGNVRDTDYDAEQAVIEDNCGQRCLAWLCVFNDKGEKVAQSI